MNRELDIDLLIRLVKADMKNPLIAEKAARTYYVIEQLFSENCSVSGGFSHGIGSRPINCPLITNLLENLKIKGQYKHAEYVKQWFDHILKIQQIEQEIEIQEINRQETEHLIIERKNYYKQRQGKAKKIASVIEGCFAFQDDEEEKVERQFEQRNIELNSKNDSCQDRPIKKVRFLLKQSDDNDFRDDDEFDMHYMKYLDYDLSQIDIDQQKSENKARQEQILSLSQLEYPTLKRLAFIDLMIQRKNILQSLQQFINGNDAFSQELTKHIILESALQDQKLIIYECLLAEQITEKMKMFSVTIKREIMKQIKNKTFIYNPCVYQFI